MKISMGCILLRHYVALPHRAGRIAIAAVSVAIWTKAIGAGHAARDPAPSAAKPERITEFFTNEVATGKSSLARINAN